jgi:hypothetical protein
MGLLLKEQSKQAGSTDVAGETPNPQAQYITI